MLMVCHHSIPRSPRIWHFAESRIRKETIAAEDILQRPRRALDDVPRIRKPWAGSAKSSSGPGRPADKMKKQRGKLAEDKGNNDNFRVKRYIAKYTINPAIAHGVFES